MSIEQLRRSRLARIGAPFVLALHAGLFCRADSTAVEAGLIEHRAAHPNPSAAYQWLQVMLEASGRSVDRYGARPTIISREMEVASAVTTCRY